MPRYLFAALLLACLVPFGPTDVKAVLVKLDEDSTVTVNGRTIRYKIVGSYNTNDQDQTVDNGKLTLKFNLDGNRHRIVVDETKVTWNDKTKTFDSITNVDIRIEGKSAEIKVDGRQAFPEPKTRR